jgi:hypothetical protein
MGHSVQLKPLYQPDEQQIQATPTVVVLALVKNEGNIISSWLSHVCELFDLVYIVDHQSTDGTREYLLEAAKSEGKIHLFSFEHPGYFQSEIINHLAQAIMQKYPTVWLFPLDADEFLSVSSREEFLSLLSCQNHERILRLNWRNCLPMYMNADQALELNFSCLFPPHPGTYNKVAVNAKTLKARNLRFTQGNHGLENASGQLIQEKQVEFIDLYHLPIRSIEHFALKCIQGYIAKISLPADRDSSGQLVHWKDMIDTVITSGYFDVNLLRKFVASYGQSNDVEIASMYDLIDQGWKMDGFYVPINQNIYAHVMNRKFSCLDLAHQALDGHISNSELNGFLRIAEESQKRIADVSLWQKDTTKFQVYKKLSESQSVNIKQPVEANEIEILHDFFSKATTPRQNPVPSTWEGHVAFLYCLLDFARPRRFVELGSQYGNCFFAACQTSQSLNDSIECIAIDMWMGDEHTGVYQDDVFRYFLRTLNRDYPKGRYIRKFFSEAVSQFEDGSIDLLHIDGLHTYEAVAEDYQTWLPKLSDQGIIMFHDTQVRERDFGVWKLWAQIKDKYPSFEFEHSHGLGIILIGSKTPRNITRLFEILARPEYGRFAKFFFSTISHISLRN